jgi:hypothetical protein
MVIVANSLVTEWRAFKDDEPGERFAHHHQRMSQDGTRAGAIARTALGVLLIAAGILMLFIPGPGLIAMLFGFGLIGGQSKTMAKALDRVEPAMRRTGRRAKRAFMQSSMITKVAIVALAALLAAAAGVLMWRWFF